MTTALYRAAAESNHVRLQWIVGGISEWLCRQAERLDFYHLNVFVASVQTESVITRLCRTLRYHF